MIAGDVEQRPLDAIAGGEIDIPGDEGRDESHRPRLADDSQGAFRYRAAAFQQWLGVARDHRGGLCRLRGIEDRRGSVAAGGGDLFLRVIGSRDPPESLEGHGVLLGVLARP